MLNANYIVHLMWKVQTHFPGEFVFLHVNDYVACTLWHVGVDSMDLDIMTAIFYLLIRVIYFVEVLPNGFVRICIF